MFTYPVYTYLVHATWLFTHLYVYKGNGVDEV